MLYPCKFVIFRFKLRGNLLACRSLSPWHASLPATTGHLTHSIKYELYGPLKINKETLQVQNMTESTVSQETNETTIMFSCG